MEAAGRQSVLPCSLHERSIVEALAGLLALDLSVLHFEPRLTPRVGNHGRTALAIEWRSRSSEHQVVPNPARYLIEGTLFSY